MKLQSNTRAHGVRIIRNSSSCIGCWLVCLEKKLRVLQDLSYHHIHASEPSTQSEIDESETVNLVKIRLNLSQLTVKQTTSCDLWRQDIQPCWMTKFPVVFTFPVPVHLWAVSHFPDIHENKTRNCGVRPARRLCRLPSHIGEVYYSRHICSIKMTAAMLFSIIVLSSFKL